MGKPITQVTIVGGGTAGWLTAIMLNARLNKNRPTNRRVQITLIESPNIPTVGVGEGTVPGLLSELKNLGLDEFEIIRRCNASFKLGVKFANWNFTEHGEPYSFCHTFEYSPFKEGVDPLSYYIAFGAEQSNNPSDSLDIHPIVSAIKANKAPKSTRDGSWGRGLRYAYHFDAALLGTYLKEQAVQRGVRHILDDIEDATVNGDVITHLHLRERGILPVELVIDCTGFRGELISKKLQEPFELYSKHLLCDRAIPIQLPNTDTAPIESCTTATALSAGWSWKIPLFTRTGTGYVYSSAHIDDETALRELCAHVGANPETVETRVIKMRVGRLRRSWVGNCIAIGLSSSFLEPLEATAIISIRHATFLVSKYFPEVGPVPEGFSVQFNYLINRFYDNIRDFITMHYYLSNRVGAFWEEARDPSVLTEPLRNNLEIWKYRLPIKTDLSDDTIFNDRSYAHCLASKGYFRGASHLIDPSVSRSEYASYQAFMDSARRRVSPLPSVRQFLSAVRHGQSETTGVPQDRRVA